MQLSFSMFRLDYLLNNALERLAALVGSELPGGLLEPLGLLSLGHLPLLRRLSLRLFGHTSSVLQPIVR